MDNIGDSPNIRSYELTGFGIYSQPDLKECDICFTEADELNQCPHCLNKVCDECWVECGEGHFICTTCMYVVREGERIRKEKNGNIKSSRNAG